MNIRDEVVLPALEENLKTLGALTIRQDAELTKLRNQLAQLMGAAESLADCIGTGYTAHESQSALWTYYKVKREIRGEVAV